jgi:hypothetical protein
MDETFQMVSRRDEQPTHVLFSDEYGISRIIAKASDNLKMKYKEWIKDRKMQTITDTALRIDLDAQVGEARKWVKIASEPREEKLQHELLNSAELNKYVPSQATQVADERAGAIVMDTFFNRVKNKIVFEEAGPNEAEEIRELIVTEPQDVPDDQALLKLFEARRMSKDLAAKAAREKFDVGGQNAAESYEMQYRLAEETIKGNARRPDLVVKLLRDEARQFLVYQVWLKEVARETGSDPNRNVTFADIKRLDGVMSYIVRTAETVGDRLGYKK